MTDAESEKYHLSPIRYILFKFDRTLAIAGIVTIGTAALFQGTDSALQISLAAISGLVGYIGGRAAK